MLFAAHDTASLSQSVKPCWCLGMMLFKFCLPPLKSCSTAGPLARWPHLPMSSLSAATAALRPVNPSGPSLPDTTEESLSGLVIFDTDPFSDRFTAQAAVRGDGPMPLPGLPPVQYVQGCRDTSSARRTHSRLLRRRCLGAGSANAAADLHEGSSVLSQVGQSSAEALTVLHVGQAVRRGHILSSLTPPSNDLQCHCHPLPGGLLDPAASFPFGTQCWTFAHSLGMGLRASPSVLAGLVPCSLSLAAPHQLLAASS